MVHNSGEKSFARNLLFIQLIIILYSLASVIAKTASGYPVKSVGFFSLYAVEIFLLGVYALLWQRILKKVDLSVAYANRGAVVFWALVWSVFLFHETVTIQNLIGILIVFCGITLVNSDRCD